MLLADCGVDSSGKRKTKGPFARHNSPWDGVLKRVIRIRTNRASIKTAVESNKADRGTRGGSRVDRRQSWQRVPSRPPVRQSRLSSLHWARG